MKLDPASAAQYALIGICLVMIGALLTDGALGIAERGTVLAGTFAVLFFIAFRGRRRAIGGAGDDGEPGPIFIPGEK